MIPGKNGCCELSTMEGSARCKTIPGQWRTGMFAAFAGSEVLFAAGSILSPARYPNCAFVTAQENRKKDISVKIFMNFFRRKNASIGSSISFQRYKFGTMQECRMQECRNIISSAHQLINSSAHQLTTEKGPGWR